MTPEEVEEEKTSIYSPYVSTVLGIVKGLID